MSSFLSCGSPFDENTNTLQATTFATTFVLCGYGGNTSSYIVLDLQDSAWARRASTMVPAAERENAEYCRFMNPCPPFQTAYSALQVVKRRQHVQAARVDTKTTVPSYQRLFWFWNRCLSSDAPSSFSIKPVSGSHLQRFGGWGSLFQSVFIVSDDRRTGPFCSWSVGTKRRLSITCYLRGGFTQAFNDLRRNPPSATQATTKTLNNLNLGDYGRLFPLILNILDTLRVVELNGKVNVKLKNITHCGSYVSTPPISDCLFTSLVVG